MAQYDYSISQDFPQGVVDADVLTVSINDSAITVALLYISSSGDVLSIFFENSLSGSEQTILDEIVNVHTPLAPGEATVNIKTNIILDTTWANFKKYLDGTIANLYFYTGTDMSSYTITTEEHGGFKHQYVLPFSAESEKTDFEGNFKDFQNTRRPYEQLAFTQKESTYTYLGNGDLDKIETVIGSKKQVAQFNYLDGELISISTTIVDA